MKDDLNGRLKELHGRRFARTVGNGTAALTVLLKALGLRDQGIAFPGGVCPNVAAAVLLSGNRPVFVDPDEKTGGLSAAALRACAEPFAAVVAVHAYGTMSHMPELEAFCASSGAVLIEDFAVAQGASQAGKPAGSFGRASIVSFGAGKVVSHGIGGAILTDDEELDREIARLDAALPPFSEPARAAAHELSARFKAAYNAQLGGGQVAAWREWPAVSASLAPAMLHRFAPEWEAPILNRLAGLAALVKGRRLKATRLAELLGGIDGLTVVAPPPGSVPWRLNALVDRDRDGLLRLLWKSGYKASSWFGPLDLYFRPIEARPAPMPAGDAFGRRVVNFWVNEEVDETYLVGVAAATRECLRRPAISRG